MNAEHLLLHERLIEIGSSWGHFGWLYQEAMTRGYKIGASMAGDEHRGRCGGGVPGTAVFGTKGGMSGVIAPELSRKAIATALRRRILATSHTLLRRVADRLRDERIVTAHFQPLIIRDARDHSCTHNLERERCANE